MSEATTEVSSEMAALLAVPSIDEMDWVDPATLPPSDLPYDDGEPMESPWHVGSGPLLKAGYIAARGGQMIDFYVGVNMFVYYSWKQVRNNEYKGPDVYFVKDVDGQKPRLYWAIWDEDGRYPDVVIELLSPTTEQGDLTTKLEIYRQKFHLTEYFCIAPQCERIIGWKHTGDAMEQLRLDERGWMWSDYFGLWIGPWHGFYQGEEHIWPRFYHADGSLVLLEAEAEKQRADRLAVQAEAEKQRANDLAERVAALEATLAQLRGGA
jgi:Uma2 family endonuclease